MILKVQIQWWAMKKKNNLSHRWQFLDTHLHIPNQIVLCSIKIQELMKERLWVVAKLRVLVLAQILNVSSVRVINFLNGQFRKLLQERTLKELLNV